ncbi:MAG: hypothetical protein IPO07_00515 [Haliscomenobacter sp.]|nr:hypothetical protein [Haliscomenobacter sp.]MBK9487416.1 hypothetical protein [Haliscomenobacter sp.]
MRPAIDFAPVFTLVAAVWPVLGWGQTVIFTNPGRVYNNNDTSVPEFLGPRTITGCSSVDFSVTFNFNMPWGGVGNMDSDDECSILGGCGGDPDNSTDGGCLDCWDFLRVRFFVNGNEVGGGIIGNGDNQQSGTIEATGIGVSPGDVVSIEIHGRTTASEERLTTSNIRITGTNAPVDLAPKGPFCQSSGSVALGANQNGITGNWSGIGVSGNSLNTNVGGAGIRTPDFTPNLANALCPIP